MLEKYRKIALAAIAGIFATALGVIGLQDKPPLIGGGSNSDQVQESDDPKFVYAMNTIIRHEGGLSDHPNDKGGVTKYGISLRYLINENIDINNDGLINKDDVIYLTRTEADKIYYKEWYKKHRYDEILNKVILTDIMDFSVNAGATQCHKTIRRAINNIVISNKKYPINGTFNQEIIDVVNLIDPEIFHAAFNAEQEKFYRGLVKKNPAFQVFLKGWLLRAKD